MAETNTTRGNRKVRKGKVVSKSGDKSIIVRSERRERHPVYGKVVSRFKKYHAHDEDNTAQVGDDVSIVETRPLSATKRWRVIKAEEK
jgi:small subunit ribosomal protein S17